MRRRVCFSGRVQGVGFRATTQQLARRHAVTGWVRNEADGTVMMEAQGDASEIEALLSDIRQAMGRNIRSEHAEGMTDLPGEVGFVIR